MEVLSYTGFLGNVALLLKALQRPTANMQAPTGEAVVVFDGYKEFITKDMTHKRRLKGKKGVSVTFSLDMSLSVTQQAFLSDPKIKQQFIFLAQDSQGCRVFHDQADADLFIVQKAIGSADTDLLILLLHHMPPYSKKFLLASDRKKNTKGRVWNIKEVQA